MFHLSGYNISILCMIRCSLLRPEQFIWVEFASGRLIHILLQLIRIHYMFCIYKFSWNIIKIREALVKDRAKIWIALTHGVRHAPKRHIFLIAGDCNTPLIGDPPFSWVFRTRNMARWLSMINMISKLCLGNFN